MTNGGRALTTGRPTAALCALSSCTASSCCSLGSEAAVSLLAVLVMSVLANVSAATVVEVAETAGSLDTGSRA